MGALLLAIVFAGTAAYLVADRAAGSGPTAANTAQADETDKPQPKPGAAQPKGAGGD